MMDAANYAKAMKDANDKTIVETQITTDGVEDFAYGGRGGGGGRISTAAAAGTGKHRRPAGTAESESAAGGQRLLVARFEEVRAGAPRSAQGQQALGDQRAGQSAPDARDLSATPCPASRIAAVQLEVFEWRRRPSVIAKADAFKDQTSRSRSTGPPRAPASTKRTEAAVGRAGLGQAVLHAPEPRHAPAGRLLADTATGEVKPVIQERMNVYIESKPLKVINNGSELVWWSERDGWGHYYLYGSDGTLEEPDRQGRVSWPRTSPTWTRKARAMYLTASGHEDGEDPYFMHFYRANLDGSGMKLLDPGDASHAVNMSDSGKYFVDTVFARQHGARVRAVRRAGRHRDAAREGGRGAADGRRVQVSRAVQGEGRRRHHGSLRRDVQAVRFRPGQEVPGDRVRVSRAADRERHQDLQPEEQPGDDGEHGVHHDRDREPRRQSAPLEVVSHLRLRQPARLRPGRQEGGHRAAGEAVSVYRYRARGHVGPLGRRLHDGGGDADLSRLLQGRLVGIGQPREQHLQQHRGARSTTA